MLLSIKGLFKRGSWPAEWSVPDAPASGCLAQHAEPTTSLSLSLLNWHAGIPWMSLDFRMLRSTHLLPGVDPRSQTTKSSEKPGTATPSPFKALVSDPCTNAMGTPAGKPSSQKCGALDPKSNNLLSRLRLLAPRLRGNVHLSDSALHRLALLQQKSAKVQDLAGVDACKTCGKSQRACSTIFSEDNWQ